MPRFSEGLALSRIYWFQLRCENERRSDVRLFRSAYGSPSSLPKWTWAPSCRNRSSFTHGGLNQSTCDVQRVLAAGGWAHPLDLGPWFRQALAQSPQRNRDDSKVSCSIGPISYATTLGSGLCEGQLLIPWWLCRIHQTRCEHQEAHVRRGFYSLIQPDTAWYSLTSTLLNHQAAVVMLGNISVFIN